MTGLTMSHVARRATLTAEERTYWILRVGAALCFVGHGAFGFITKAAWLPYFAVVGIPESVAWTLMPLVGALDVTAGMMVFFAPRVAPVAYMAVWALWTALLRPLSGESVFEAIERAGNYGVPLTFLLLTGWPRDRANLWAPLRGPLSDRVTLARLRSVLKWTTVLLLAGHGALGAIDGKAGLAAHYASVGLPSTSVMLVGWLELGAAAAIAIRPTVWLLVGVAVWKMATESLFMVAGSPIWEWVERAGSYAAPLALAALLTTRAGGRDRPGGS